ncbi:MAG: PAS domain S-box protein, partial [Verrucomicrobia bacterium]|nr:PAS domain S-box protein [Verrucomicrobiota bacterium]
TFPYEISGSPLRNSEGVVTGTICVTRDITERKSMEEALRAEQRLAATGRMAAGIAHEINNPLNGIRNCFQLVKDAIPKGHQAVRHGRLIEKEIDRMAGIIKQMFTLYGNQGSVPTAVDIRELMGEITDLHSPEVHSKGMRLRVAIGQGLAPAFAPRGALTEALHNLIRNAIDASTSCRGTISIMAK